MSAARLAFGPVLALAPLGLAAVGALAHAGTAPPSVSTPGAAAVDESVLAPAAAAAPVSPSSMQPLVAGDEAALEPAAPAGRLLPRPLPIHVPGAPAASVDAADPAMRPASADLPAAPEVARSATFTFEPVVEISRPRLYLGEVATCFGRSALCEEAYGVDLGPSPEPGRTTFLHPDKVLALLGKEWPDADVRVSGAKLVKVTALASALDEDTVLAELRSQLGENLPPDGRFVAQVDKASIALPPRLRPAAYRIEFPELTPAHFANPEWVLKTLAGNVRLPAACVMEADADGQVVPFTVQAQINLREKLPVPSHDLAKGEVIRASDLTPTFVDVVRGGVRPVTAAAALVGRRLRRAAPAFAPLYAADVEIPKAVKRGQLVRLVLRTSDLEVTGHVIVKSDGGYGQTLDAVYPATKKQLRVRVLDSSTVEYVQ